MAKIDVTKTELVWPGKYDEDGTRKEVPRVGLPFQIIETVNESRATREARKSGVQASLFDVHEGGEGHKQGLQDNPPSAVHTGRRAHTEIRRMHGTGALNRARTEDFPASEPDLAAAAAALASQDAPLTWPERALVREAPAPSPELLSNLRRGIARGGDPLGEAFCRLRTPEARRGHGAVYTPAPIVEAMIRWAADAGAPARIVDPGAGSGRFLLAAGEAFPDAGLVGIEIDPLAALLLRANAAVRGMAERLTLLVADYRAAALPEIDGQTLFLGNPPYVRHHDIAPEWKRWLSSTAAGFGFRASRLAGLHVHFFLKTYQLCRDGDYGAFITSSEWLDVNYGAVLRKLLVNGFGAEALHVIAPAAMPFAETATTGAITCFRAGRRGRGIRFREVFALGGLGALEGGRIVSRARLDAARRWSPFLRPAQRPPPGSMELGEICRVHRGQVTGCNAVWIAGGWTGALPEAVLIPAVTRARELLDAGAVLSRAGALRRVIELPVDLGELDDADRRKARRFLRWAEGMGADQSYVARHRRAWWAVGLRPPAPILCTYMARRPPAFVRNRCGARHLNIAHGLYPREALPPAVLDNLASWLRDNVSVSAGRTYAGGLTKFEPKELERIPIPKLERLHG